MTNSKTITFDEILKKYEEITQESLKYCCFVRDIAFQKQKIKELELFKKEIKSYKHHAVINKSERQANIFFHFQCCINSIISVLQMWISLKTNKFDIAWDYLIDAQEYVLIAFKADNNHIGLDNYLNHLYKIERAIFPEFPYFNSWGCIIQGGKCSVCGSDYGTCNHLEGLVYWGKYCTRINFKPIRLDHSSVVQNPKDRRCIIRYISTDKGEKRDYLTWKIKFDLFWNKAKSKRTMVGKIYSFKILDIF
jgi:hypothetical protein